MIRANIAYNNFDAIEDGYSINLRALSSFAQEVYHDDPCERFIPKILDQNVYDVVDIKLAAKLAFKMAEQRQRQRQNIALRAG